MEHKTEPFYIELEFQDKRNKKSIKKLFVQYDIVNDLVWFELNGIPTALLCAMCDGTPVLQSDCGAGKKTLKRLFFTEHWLINDWGGDEEVVKAIDNRRKIERERLNHYREKYKNDMSREQKIACGMEI